MNPVGYQTRDRKWYHASCIPKGKRDKIIITETNPEKLPRGICQFCGKPLKPKT